MLSIAARIATLCVASVLVPSALVAQNAPPNTPQITEPVTTAGRVINPQDVHMETAPFADPNVGDQHAASDWEIWQTSPQSRVWAALGVTGLEKIHAHFGDGVFEGTHAGRTQLLPSTSYFVRVRHKDDSGDPATEWSGFAQRTFTTGVAGRHFPLEVDDVADDPAPRWLGPNGLDIALPNGARPASLRLENNAGQLLLSIQGGPNGNVVTNPAALTVHAPVRVVIDAGNTGGNLILPESSIVFAEHDCEVHTILLPAVSLIATGLRYYWVSAEGATYLGASSQSTPSFTSPARGLAAPWVAREPGYSIDVVASGFRLPVNIAFVPNAGTGPSDPFFYVTELYGTVKTITNDGTVLTYATNLLNYAPNGQFPGAGEQGVTGIAVDPVSGDVFVSMLRQQTGGTNNEPRVVRFSSTDGGRTAATMTTLRHFVGEYQGQSHQISRLEIVHGLLYCHMGDGFDSATALNLTSYRGKILCMNLDGSPAATNPFYDPANGIDARDYVFAYGVRNPFGGAWRAADDSRYVVENGPDIDRFAKLVLGRNYGWNGSSASMRNYALYVWAPASGPVNLAFVQPETFGGSGFPADKQGHAFVSESGATYAVGQQSIGKKITEWVLDANGALVAGPIPFVEYAGDGRATVVGLAAGPDGLYFSELYLDVGSSQPTAAGARVLRVRRGGADDCNANGDPDWCELASGAGADCNQNGVLDECDIRSGTSTDFDGDDVPDECEPLQVDRTTLSAVTGGQVTFTLDAGPQRAGQIYWVLGSMTGTSPGVPLGNNVVLPLNTLNDPWFEATIAFADTALFSATLGFLDVAGRATASFNLPPNVAPGLIGRHFDHAFLTLDPVQPSVFFASNAMPLDIVR